MTRSTRILALAATLTVLATSLLTATAAQAYVPGAPPCYGPTCIGFSPYITNHEGRSCASDATSLQSVSGPGDGQSNVVTLRWSEFCHANWAKWTGSSPAYANYWVETGDGHREFPFGSGYTYMVNGNLLARAGIVAYTFRGDQCGQSSVACTAWW